MQKFSWLTQLRTYPFFLGIAIGISFGLTDMQGYVLFEQILILGLVLALVALSFNFIFYLVLRDADKAALLSTIVLFWILLFNGFVSFSRTILSVLHLPAPDGIVYLFPYVLIGLLTLWSCYKAPSIKFVSMKLSTTIVFLTVICLVWEASYVVQMGAKIKEAIKIRDRINGQISLKADYKPDIYYIILDAMGRADTLRNLFNIDDIELLTYLKKQGFFIADDSCSNYDRTILSLSSSLNLNYINYLQELLPKNVTDPTVPYRLIQNNQLAACLRGLGYKIVNISSGFSPTEYNPYADMNINSNLSNDGFIAVIYEMTVQSVLEKYNHFFADAIRKKRTWIFTHIDQVEHIKGPKFVFVHVLLPHPPFIFTADGGKLPLSHKLESENYTVEKYRGQASFALSQAQKLIESLMKAPGAPPIIVLQSDHGPALNMSYPYSNNYLKQRFGILNAYFLPHCQANCLYNSISPVNTFRVILNQYFHANLPLLPDMSYYAPPLFYTQLTPRTDLRRHLFLSK